MKIPFLTFALATVFTLAVQGAPPEKSEAPAAAPKKTIATDKPVPKSSFGIPANAQDGHDPFFPTSDRLFAVKISKPSSSAPTASIVFNGISGSDDRRFAMINGHTFAEGERASVNTSSGRVPVLLVAIKGDTAIVEISGERRELIFQGR